MLGAVISAGPSYKPPDRLKFGMGRDQNLGSILSSGLEDCREKKQIFLRTVKHTGGNLNHDGAKNHKRSALNSVLLTINGAFFVQVHWCLY